MARIALATASEYPNLTPGDRNLRAHLDNNDHETSIEMWDDDSVQWADYDSVLIRSCWDYSSRYHEFENWIRRLDDLDVKLWNPAETVHWNMRKSYLQDLREAGVSIPSTVFVPEGTTLSLRKILTRKDWDMALLKPMIGAGGSNMHRITQSEVDEYQETFDRLNNEMGTLVQEYRPEIEQNGEWSLVFFNGEYEYAIHKQPRDGEYQAHADYGADFIADDPPETVLELARSASRKINRPCLYSRMDIINADPTPFLIEAELIEPNFYFDTFEAGAKHFANEIETALSEGLTVGYIGYQSETTGYGRLN